MAYRESQQRPVIFCLGAGVIFFIWLLGFLGFMPFEGSDNLFYMAFQCLFVFPVFCYMVQRLCNPKNRIEVIDGNLHIRSSHFTPQVIQIPMDAVRRAEAIDFDTGDGFEPGLRIYLHDREGVCGYKGDRYFGIVDGKFEGIIGESTERILEMVQAINREIRS